MSEGHIIGKGAARILGIDLDDVPEQNERRTMKIKLKEYLRPDGEIGHRIVEIDDTYKSAYEAMRIAGYNLAVEEGTGGVIIYLEENDTTLDIDIQICAFPELQSALESMLVKRTWEKYTS